MNVTKKLWWYVISGLGNGLVSAGNKPLSESILTPYGITRPQYVNSLWPSDVIWRQGSRSTLAQVMACCLTAPSHYLNQCWLMISEVFWHSPDSNFIENTWDIYHWNEFENYSFETVVKSPRGQCVNSCYMKESLTLISRAQLQWRRHMPSHRISERPLCGYGQGFHIIVQQWVASTLNFVTNNVPQTIPVSTQKCPFKAGFATSGLLCTIGIFCVFYFYFFLHGCILMYISRKKKNKIKCGEGFFYFIIFPNFSESTTRMLPVKYQCDRKDHDVIHRTMISYKGPQG